MLPGHDLDLLVAEVVFGNRYCTCAEATSQPGTDSQAVCEGCGLTQPPAQKYSTEENAAWEVVEKLRAEGEFKWNIRAVLGQWQVEVEADGKTVATVTQSALPLAICQAALLAKSGKAPLSLFRKVLNPFRPRSMLEEGEASAESETSVQQELTSSPFFCGDQVSELTLPMG